MPQTNADDARELARNSPDCSFLLTHLIRQNNGQSDQEEKDILISILDLNDEEPEPLLNASAVGWYKTITPNIYNPVSGNFDGNINNQAVCFTESTLAGLRAHRDLFNVKYGLAFDRDDLFNKGANPCLNISESLLNTTFIRTGERYPRSLYNFIPSELHPYVNIIHNSFDATHEREWRYPGNMKFEWQDLKFVFCPESDFGLFNGVQVDSIPCLFDLEWLDRV